MGLKPQCGISAASATSLYLPVESDPGRLTVAGQRADQDSLLHAVRDLIAPWRSPRTRARRRPGAPCTTRIPLAYLRGGRFLVVFNPSDRARVLPHDRPELADATVVRHTCVKLDQTTIIASPFSLGIFQL
jgi:maltose alpha-D-glucosyltransferase/alpha-amylase